MTGTELLTLCKQRRAGYPDGVQADKIDIQIKKLEARINGDKSRKNSGAAGNLGKG
jgi:hypothetical protein